jgi:hypothetical protein
MAVPTIYRVINKSNNKIRHSRDANKVACWFLGRRVNNFIVVKSDEEGDRVVKFSEFDADSLKQAMESA